MCEAGREGPDLADPDAGSGSVAQCYNVFDGGKSRWTRTSKIRSVWCPRSSKILDFPNMTRLPEALTFVLERVEKKNAPSLRISGSRYFNWRYFQLHRSTPSRSKLPLLSGNFGIFGFRDVSLPTNALGAPCEPLL